MAIEFYAESEREKITSLFSSYIEKGTPFLGDFQIITTKGETRWVHSRGEADYGASGKVSRVTGTFQDITDKKNNEKRLSLMFDQSADSMMTLEPPTWQFTSCNPSTVKLFKVDNESEFTKLGPWNISPEFQPCGTPSVDLAKKHIQNAMEKGSEVFDWVHQNIKGEDIECVVLLSRIIDRDKTYIQAVVRDVTEQKKMEKELRESHQYLELALEGDAFLVGIKMVIQQDLLVPIWI